jgi:hypothetical protein
MRERSIRTDAVFLVLSTPDSDELGNKPWKRELVGDTGWGRIKVVVALLDDEVRVLTVHPVSSTYRRR